MTREKEEKRRKEEKISPYLYRSGLVMECAALCHGSAREKKRNARKEKDRAAEIWRRIEKMGKDERGCGILPFGECKKLPENICRHRTTKITPKGTILDYSLTQ